MALISVLLSSTPQIRNSKQFMMCTKKYSEDQLVKKSKFGKSDTRLWLDEIQWECALPQTDSTNQSSTMWGNCVFSSEVVISRRKLGAFLGRKRVGTFQRIQCIIFILFPCYEVGGAKLRMHAWNAERWWWWKFILRLQKENTQSEEIYWFLH